MAAETTREFEALEAQAQALTAVFVKDGFEPVAPAIIQPAGVFLDAIGESLRGRTYVFNDPQGDELCLRPDLTVPVCRLHLARDPSGGRRARYCYNGVAFRFQPAGADAAHPREFRQAGIEAFGDPDPEEAEARVLATVMEALSAAGLGEWTIRIGDLGLFGAVLDAADMPARWRERLRAKFWRQDAFRAELERLTSAPADRRGTLPPALAGALEPDTPVESEAAVAAYLEREGIDLIGSRTLSEITASLVDAVADMRASPLSAAAAALMEHYVALTAPAKLAGARLTALASESGVAVTGALDSFHRRLRLFAEAGLDLGRVEFSAEFGRDLEYYTGFVFEVVTPPLGSSSPVAGGGRYDHLLCMAGAPRDVPAVGAAIHTERLLGAAARARGAKS